MSQPARTERPIRTRTYSYVPPVADRTGGAALSGADGLARILSGDVAPPPIAATLGFDLVLVDRGVAIFEGMPAEWQYNPLGSVHGGWIATLLDSAVGCAVHSMLEPGVGYTTLTLSLSFVRAVTTATGLVRAEGRAVNVGNRVATAEGRLVGVADGKLYATATTTCLVIAPR